MGAVPILQPHDCMMHHNHNALSQMSLPFMTPSSPSNKAHSINGPKKIHLASRKRNPRPKTTTPPDSSKNLLMGQVKILRRGEELPGSTEDGRKGLLLLPLPLPPEEFVPVRRVNGFYAGSAAFVDSPPPSSVPLPGFFAKRVFSACDNRNKRP